MPDTKKLFDLQAVDVELDTRNTRLVEIAARLGDESNLEPHRADVVRFKAEVVRASAGQAEFDDAITGFTGRIEEAEGKLYSGRITLSRELQDLQADINMIKRQRGEQEDLLLEALDVLEQAQVRLNDATSLLDRSEQTWLTDQEAMGTERLVLQSEVAERQSQRDIRAASVPGTELALYERVRKTHNGVAVAKMRAGMCESCRVALPTGQVASVRSAPAPVRCPSCGLILLAV
jgi:predicted  nucleic acid-binding Zn-ribbon protein